MPLKIILTSPHQKHNQPSLKLRVATKECSEHRQWETIDALESRLAKQN